MIAHDGYELILGSSIDAQFGPVLLFGAGGLFVEVFKDRALGLPPLNRTLRDG
jgi:acetyltransferase